MTGKDIVKLVLIHCCVFIIGTLLFIVSFHTPLFKRLEVLFYRGILLLITTCLVFTILLLVSKRRSFFKLFTYRDIILVITILFSFNLLFFTHFPVTAERSISLFMLGYMDKNSGNPLTKEEITKIFIDKYIFEYQEIEKRFIEQIVTGDIVIDKNGYRITNRGRLIIRFFNFIDDVFMIDKKIISPT